jgi:hypothetical protein
MDTAGAGRENSSVVGPGASRQRITRTLSAAYAGGLISQDTYVRRLDELLSSTVVDPSRLVGDLSFRVRRRHTPLAIAFRRLGGRLRAAVTPPGASRPLLLALDWDGGQRELLLGRHEDCDVRLLDSTVSRRHARLVFRDGIWIIVDLDSTNGSAVNRQPVRRCELRPGDRLSLGEAVLRID